MTQTYQHSRGSAIIYILVAIALLAALTISLTKMSSNTSGNLEPEQARLAAQQIINYAKAIDNAVQFVRTQNGCGQTQISFEGASGYTNTYAPTDKRCHIFDMAGGGQTWKPHPKNSTLRTDVRWVFNAWNWSVTGLGPEGSGSCTSNCPDLIMFLPNLTLEVCQHINFILGITTNLSATPPDIYSTLPASALVNTKFNGVYGTSTGSRLGAPGMTIYMKPAACVVPATTSIQYNNISNTTTTATPPGYLFYYTLLIR